MNKGEIWLINLDPTVGAEIKKSRPAIIVNENAMGILPLRIIIPITEWRDQYKISSWMVRLEPDKDNCLDKISAADTFQIRSVSTTRFIKLIGKLNELYLAKISRALDVVLNITQQ
jgi:mRNA interferase MazF